MTAKPKKIKERFTMEATVIATGETVWWVVYDAPDYGGIKSKHKPATLTGIRVRGGPNRRAI